MTAIEIEAGDLLADASHDRRVTGLLIPYGEIGRTNLGRVAVEPGAIALPADPMVVGLNDSHRVQSVLGRGADLVATDAGIVASFDVARTPEGDELLAEVRDPAADPATRRTKLSAEVTGIKIRAGKIVGGILYGAAATVAGAFPSAALLANDVGDDPEDEAPADSDPEDEAPADSDPEDEAPADSDPEDEAPADSEHERTNMPAASAPADLAARARGGRPAVEINSPADLYAAIADAHTRRDSDLLAALSDITGAAHTPNVSQPQWVGELWSGVGYARQYIPLFNHKDLTSWTVNGWRWVVRPEVAKYAGNKTDVPSNQPTTEPVTIDAERIAGAHDIDRKYRDFKDVGFIESYYAAMTESYAEVSDVDVLDQVIAALTATAVGTVPAGVDPAIAGVVRGWLSVFRATRRMPTFALISDTAWERLIYTREDDSLPYVEKLLGLPGGFGEGFLRPTVDLAADQVLVGVKDAVTVHELGGGAPIRVDALDIARGGEDHGVFGYTAVNIHREDGLALVDTDPAA